VTEPRKVRVTYRKFDGSLHWNAELAWLGEDQFGIWLGAVPLTPWRRGDKPPVRYDYPQVVLFPRDAGWTATFSTEGNGNTEIYVDVTTVPVWLEDEVTMVDLDLDVVRQWDGSVRPLDEDEFAEHQVHYGYPAETIRAAEDTFGWLLKAVGARAEPFGVVGHGWLARTVIA
jgi:protein associated with RNAse G/E